MLTRATPLKVAQLGARLDAFNDFATSDLTREDQRIDDPVADRMLQLHLNALNLHIVDSGTTSAASYAAFIEYIAETGFSPGRVLIVAVQDELDKWNAAFQGKEYFCGDLDAQPLRGGGRDYPASGMLVSVCSSNCARRHLVSVTRHTWKIVVVDAGAARASDMFGTFRGESLLLSIKTDARHIFSRSQHASGAERIPRGVFDRPKAYLLDLEEAVFRLRFMRESYLHTQVEGEDCREFWRATDTPEQRYLRWLVQGDFSRRLIADAHAVRVPM